jgi:hypothetical protein
MCVLLVNCTAYIEAETRDEVEVRWIPRGTFAGTMVETAIRLPLITVSTAAARTRL